MKIKTKHIIGFFVAFLNKLIDIKHSDQVKDFMIWKKVLINYKEEKYDEQYDATLISIIDIWDLKPDLDKNSSFIKLLESQDLELIKENKKIAEKSYDTFINESKTLGLDLIPINNIISFSWKTILFNYTSKERVDFRELVKQLALKLKKRIQLRHVWIRDRASLIWWFGICWRELCCTKFLRDIVPVKTESIKVQEFFHKSSDHLSWACWKLKCCLNYEIWQYKQLRKKMPKYWDKFTIKWEKWVVAWLDIFNQRVKIKFDNKSEVFNLEELSKK